MVLVLRYILYGTIQSRYIFPTVYIMILLYRGTVRCWILRTYTERRLSFMYSTTIYCGAVTKRMVPTKALERRREGVATAATALHSVLLPLLLLLLQRRTRRACTNIRITSTMPHMMVLTPLLQEAHYLKINRWWGLSPARPW